ncbi:hypothetical protein CYMTET_49187 [Cymbomonas tetramitiformis]|uniref:ZZ-type domain-containing protein n=1 Tax=Cymbomonas tetramitiformis TaxID=36881 RepID=A0AAE0EU50_9CHLO|nr:hypothetical protein CYMTET_49187 [Cymbomonas tetramitiformis]
MFTATAAGFGATAAGVGATAAGFGATAAGFGTTAAGFGASAFGSTPNCWPVTTSRYNVQGRPAPAKVEHEGVSCDVCGAGNPLVGLRHKCLVCVNVDLCTGCLELHDPAHPVVRFAQPVDPGWHGVMTAGFLALPSFVYPGNDFARPPPPGLEQELQRFLVGGVERCVPDAFGAPATPLDPAAPALADLARRFSAAAEHTAGAVEAERGARPSHLSGQLHPEYFTMVEGTQVAAPTSGSALCLLSPRGGPIACVQLLCTSASGPKSTIVDADRLPQGVSSPPSASPLSQGGPVMFGGGGPMPSAGFSSAVFGRPEPPAKPRTFFGLVAEDGVEVSLVLTNLCPEGLLKIEVARCNAEGARSGAQPLNAVNVLRPRESTVLSSDQTTGLALLLRGVQSALGGSVTVQAELGASALGKAGGYLLINVEGEPQHRHCWLGPSNGFGAPKEVEGGPPVWANLDLILLKDRLPAASPPEPRTGPRTGGYGESGGPTFIPFGATAPAPGIIPFGATTAAPGIFGAPTAAPGTFGATAPAPGIFGAPTAAPGTFGATTPAPGIFGAPTAAPGIFGAPQPTGGFGGAPPATGGFGGAPPATGGSVVPPATGGSVVPLLPRGFGGAPPATGVRPPSVGQASPVPAFMVLNAQVATIDPGRQVGVERGEPAELKFTIHLERAVLGFAVQPALTFRNSKQCAEGLQRRAQQLLAEDRAALTQRARPAPQAPAPQACALCNESSPPPDAMLLPCGHRCVHAEEANLIDTCPICSSSITAHLLIENDQVVRVLSRPARAVPPHVAQQISTGAFAKPVVYVYSRVRAEVAVQVALHGIDAEFSLLIPGPDNGVSKDSITTQSAEWNVLVGPDGILTSAHQPPQWPPVASLFWESTGSAVPPLRKPGTESFCVPCGELGKWLLDALCARGLSPREYTEMSTYWAGRFAGRAEKHVVLRFLSAAEINAVSSLSSNPSADAILRVYIVFALAFAPPSWCSTKLRVDPGSSSMDAVLRVRDDAALMMVEWGGTEVQLIDQDDEP